MKKTVPQWHQAKLSYDRLIAFETYDGPTLGIVFREGSSKGMVFRLLAWDERRKRRVFSLSPTNAVEGENLIAGLSRVEAPHFPDWWLRSAYDTHGLSDAIQLILSPTRLVDWVVLSENLLKEISAGVSLESYRRRREFDKLSERTPSDAEVTNASFETWVAFLDEDAPLEQA